MAVNDLSYSVQIPVHWWQRRFLLRFIFKFSSSNLDSYNIYLFIGAIIDHYLPFLRFHFAQKSPFNRTSSIANAFLPQSPHDAMAIPLMNSTLVIDIECLQFGHLYCLVEVISATRHNHASWHHQKFLEMLVPFRFLSLHHFCIL